MAFNTDISLRDDIIYSIYIRSHTEEGTFLSVIPDLPRIKALGTDIVWFMPIHPIGEKGKKGSLGCPYANRDYRSTNPSYGTLEDFKVLVDEIHALGMKCMIDVVYNHTSPDAVLVDEHPEFYYRKKDGSFGNKTGDWADVIDLDYNNKALWDYQIESLKMWAEIVDGFRCDVASCVPVDFWQKAREAVAGIKPDFIWLAETIHSSFNVYNRINGFLSATDSEMYSAFDIEYDYDIREVFDDYMEGKLPLSAWLNALNQQEATYPDNYIKLRYIENHDQPRTAFMIPDENKRRNFLALMYFLKGTTLLYAGQEYSCTHQPSLFEREVFERNETGDISPFLAKLGEIKKTALSAADYFSAFADDEAGIATVIRSDGFTKKLGVFALDGRSKTVPVVFKFDNVFPDGEYENLIDGSTVIVKDGKLTTNGEPIIITE